MTSELPEPSDAHLSTSSTLTSWSHWSLSMLAVPTLMSTHNACQRVDATSQLQREQCALWNFLAVQKTLAPLTLLLQHGRRRFLHIFSNLHLSADVFRHSTQLPLLEQAADQRRQKQKQLRNRRVGVRGKYSNEAVSCQLTVGAFSSGDLPELATEVSGKRSLSWDNFRATGTFGVHGGLERLGAISQAVGPDASNSPFEVHINCYRRAQGASTKSH